MTRSGGQCHEERQPVTDQPQQTETYPATQCEDGACRTVTHELIGEEPLLIRVDGTPYSVVMRTPGDEIFHAAGFCLGEGIIGSADDFMTVGHCRDLDPNVIDIRLKPERREKIPDILARRGFVSQTSCGICGKEMIEDLYQRLTPVDQDFRLEVAAARECLGKLSERQQFYNRTRGSHAAMILDRQLETVSFGEDVGRHNALDKAIGQALMNGRLSAGAVLVLSSRISYELVQKAARARLPVLLSMSRPTALAAKMGQSLHLTIACTDKGTGFICICGEKRIVW